MNTDYSNLRLRDSINTYQELIDYAIELNHKVIAITEHETTSNAVKVLEYYEEIKKEHPDFKVILGNEIYLCRNDLTAENFDKDNDKYYHFILLAKDAVGHQQIREISTRAWKRSWLNGKMRRVPTYYQDLIDIIGADPGHIIGSTACLGSFVATKLLQWQKNPDEVFYNKILAWLKNMQSIFGEEDFYLEMQPSDNPEQIFVNNELKKISEKLNIKYLITTDSHYCKKQDREIHKAFITSQEGEREVDAFYATTYLMSDQEIKEYFSYFTSEELQKAYQAILEIKDKCEDYKLSKPLKIPNLKWKTQAPITDFELQNYIRLIPELKNFVTSRSNADNYLVKAIINGIKKHEDLQNEEAYEAINECLNMTWVSSQVNKAEWSAYFLNLQQILEICWSAGTLVGPARGSGAGFILLYVLDITQINPLREKTKTQPWRFLNPERVSVLDIDVDIGSAKREQVLNALRKFYGEDRVSNVATFGTEKAKSAIQTAARGIGLDNDTALYIASLIPSDRGQVRTLKQCYYGDEENGFSPVSLFVKEMNNNPKLWAVAQKIEGLCCRMGEHAGGVIFVDEDFTNSVALMRAPNGDIVTQYDLHDCEKNSLIKIDLLSIEALDKIQCCLELLAADGYIDKNLSLREQYEQTIGIYNLEREAPEMWKLIWEHKIQSFFQMEKQSGIKGIEIIKPKSVDELAVLNSVIRLMAQDKDSKQPLEIWAENRKDINNWIKEMKSYGLTSEEIDWLKHHEAITDGICESQEGLMSLVQEPLLGGNNLSFADRCRKGIAKKQGKLFQECEKEFYKNIKEKQLSQKLAHYVWDVLLRVQRGYSFNRSHCLAYSLVGLQEMNLCYRFPIIYWDCACLITNSGGATGGTDYDKVAIAINKAKKAGTAIKLPDINYSDYGFKPDIKNNQIICGLKSLVNIGDELVHTIIDNRNYQSIEDFYERIKPNKQAMISLIMAGAFDDLLDRTEAMIWFISETCGKKKNINLQNMKSILNYKILPQIEHYQKAIRFYEFNRYLKAICTDKKSEYFNLDNRALAFLEEMGLESLTFQRDNIFYIDKKQWDKKIYQKEMDVIRLYLQNHQEEVKEKINQNIFMEEWNKYASGTLSTWEMNSLCFYQHSHELISVDREKYGLQNFKDLPTEPIVEREFKRGTQAIKLFKLTKICGTVIAKDKNHGLFTLLEPDGNVVTVRLGKERFAIYDKQISVKDATGKKTVLEKSWLQRGSLLMLQGMRSGDEFIAKKYASTGGHTLYKIVKIEDNGELILLGERKQGDV